MLENELIDLLNTRECDIIIELAHPTFVFHTAIGVKNRQVSIPKESITIPIEDITKVLVDGQWIIIKR